MCSCPKRWTDHTLNVKSRIVPFSIVARHWNLCMCHRCVCVCVSVCERDFFLSRKKMRRGNGFPHFDYSSQGRTQCNANI